MVYLALVYQSTGSSARTGALQMVVQKGWPKSLPLAPGIDSISWSA